MPAPIDLTGQRFGTLRVLERVYYPIGKKWPRWFCICDCGGCTVTSTGHLRQGRTTSCGCFRKEQARAAKHIHKKRGRKRKDRRGEVYGKLTLISEVEYGRWKCRCECGKVVVRTIHSMKRSRCSSCGCVRHTLPPGIAARNGMYSKYMAQARRYKREFRLTRQQLYSLIEGGCAYCGQPPAQITRAKNSEYTYNGIDRVDNTRGYVIDNCVPCCKMCNYMKRDTPYDVFLAHIGRIQQFHHKMKKFLTPTPVFGPKTPHTPVTEQPRLPI